MGFFSWKTQDTNRSIANRYSGRETFPVTMISSNGDRYLETDYEGYGIFGGKDYYELLAEMNGITEGDTEQKRLAGIDLVFGKFGNNQGYPHGDNPHILHPNLVEFPESWGTYRADPPENCEYQGYFYGSDEDDEGWDDGDDEGWDDEE